MEYQEPLYVIRNVSNIRVFPLTHFCSFLCS